MTPELFDRLLARQNELLELFLTESDPAVWPGAGIAPCNMDKGTRGDRVWVKRDAAASIVLASKIGTLVQAVRLANAVPPSGQPPTEDPTARDDLDDELKAAEKEAIKLMARAQTASKTPYTSKAPRG